MKNFYRAGLLLSALALSIATHAASKPAEPATAKINAAVLNQLNFADQQAFKDAKRGFIATLDDGKILNQDGSVAWDVAAHAFIGDQAAPASVNPSLWRQAQLNNINGLFKITDGIYQVRGFDLANMTIVEGDDGLIIIDPLLTPATAKAALELYRRHGSDKPVAAVIYTHNHVDHFGGVRGVVSDQDISSKRVRIYAPDGFMDHAVSENVIAGNAMMRRASYMYGSFLPTGVTGHVDNGLGKALASGPITLIPPTDLITENGTKTIAGVEIEFHLAQGSEAQSEMMMYFPASRVLNTAEVTSQNLHNLYTLRGAEVRDASKWSRYIDEVREEFGPRTDILIAQHHWPAWSPEAAEHFLTVQRDLYKYLHDQSVRLMNQGLNPGDIAERISLPKSLEQEWSARDYYGTLRHNARAIYQRYLGWYDANPANLNPLPADQQAKKTIDYMGGVDKVVAQAKEDFARGDYRWVASIMNQAVFAQPEHQGARELGADALEQLGYQAESGPWRNVYLSAAQDLRKTSPTPPNMGAVNADLLQSLDTGMFFDLLGVRLNGPAADGKHVVLNWVFPDTKEQFRVTLNNATLTWLPERQAQTPDATVTLSRATLNTILMKQNSFPRAIANGDIKIDGDPAKLMVLLQLIEEPKPLFPLIEPQS